MLRKDLIPICRNNVAKLKEKVQVKAASPNIIYYHPYNQEQKKDISPTKPNAACFQDSITLWVPRPAFIKLE